MASGQGGGTVALGKLPIEQLEQIEESMSTEVEALQRNAAMLRDGVVRLQSSKEGSLYMSKMTDGSDIMVPLTGSMYVPGTVKNPNAVLVDIGTGYFVEKTPQDAAEYFGRREKILKQEGDKVAATLTEKRQHLEAVTSVLQRKKAAAAQQRLAGASSAR